MNYAYLKNVRPVEQSFDGVGQVDLSRPSGPEHDPSLQKIDDFIKEDDKTRLPRLDNP